MSDVEPIGPPAPPAPTATQRDKRIGLHNQSQRRINLMWETTQASIALSVVGANIAVLFVTLTNGTAKESMMANAFFLVIGFYFGRTNHTKTGGITARGNQVHEE